MHGASDRLVDSTSPYLLQHQDNPVDWQERGPAAVAAAEPGAVPVPGSIDTPQFIGATT